MAQPQWQPSLPTAYTWEQGALYRLPTVAVEANEVMWALRQGPWWVIEMASGFFQVVGRSRVQKILTIFVEESQNPDYEDQQAASESVSYMQICGARPSLEFEEKYYLKVVSDEP